MGKDSKHIVVWLLLVVFILPTFLKLEHHHDHKLVSLSCHPQITEQHEPCAVCDYEFSVFESNASIVTLPSQTFADQYYNHYQSVNNSTLAQYSFLLRAPPYQQS